MRRKRTPMWRTVQQILAEAQKVVFKIERGPMAPDRYLECSYEGSDGIEQRAHRATAPNLRKALQASRETWTLSLVSGIEPHIERFVYCRITPPAQTGAPAAPTLD